MAEDEKPQLKSVPTKLAQDVAGENSVKGNGATPPGESSQSGKPRETEASRPSVVSLNYPEKKALHKAFMPFLKGGGLFLPTTQKYELNDEIFLLVTLPDSSKAIPVPGSVVWKTPPGAQDGRRQGIGIEFKGREGNSLRNRIEGLLGAKLGSATPTFTM